MEDITRKRRQSCRKTQTECYTRVIPTDEEMEEPKNENQEDKPEKNFPTKDAEKSKEGQEMESQGNNFSSTPCATTDKNDNMQQGNQQPNFTEDNNPENLENQHRPTLMTTKENIIDKDASSSIPKDANKCKVQYLRNEQGNQQSDLQEDNNSEILKNQPRPTPMTTKEKIIDKDASSSSPKGANKSKVHYIGNYEAKEKKGDLHPKESDDAQTTDESNSKGILNTKRIDVKSAENDDNSTKQSQPDSYPLDQNENAGKEESPGCEPQSLTSKPYDAKQNNIKQTSAISSEEEEGKFVEETTSEEDEKPVKTSKFGLMPNLFKKRKNKRKKREKVERKKIQGTRKQKEMEEKKKGEKEEKEEKKRQKKIEKKRSKEQKKKEMEEKKKGEKEEKEEKKRQKKLENEEKQKLKKNEKQESKKGSKKGRKEIKV